jgi:hypothetical protein
MTEIVDLPAEDFSEKRPVNFRFRTQAFPDQTFRASFEWNVVRERYVWEVEHIERGVIITKSIVNPLRTYDYADFMSLYFLDPSFNEFVAHPELIGDVINMYIKPKKNGQPVSEWRDQPDWYDDSLVGVI